MPDQFIFAGNDYLYINKKEKKKFFQEGSIYNISLNSENKKNIHENELSEIRNLLTSQPTGIVLNSSFFVLNILKFEKIPFNKKKLEEIVNWRIERIFPEDQKLYIHQYYILNSKYILSILLRKEVKKTIDTFFYNTGVKQAYCGSSTIELINILYNYKNPLRKFFISKNTPDFFIELWGNSATILFQDKLIPFYVRKFNFLNKEELAQEIEKTINYIKTSYNVESKSYSLFNYNSNLNSENMKEDLEGLNLIQINQIKRSKGFMDGVSV